MPIQRLKQFKHISSATLCGSLNSSFLLFFFSKIFNVDDVHKVAIKPNKAIMINKIAGSI